MSRILPLLLVAVVACTPSPWDTAMSSSKVPEAAGPSRDPSDRVGRRPPAAFPILSGQDPVDPTQAARGPTPDPVSAAANPLPAGAADSPEEAHGRQVLSTAFVRVDADGHLTVELRDGRVLILRDVVMRPKDYCGARVLGGSGKARYCGGYADVAAARPGGMP